MRVGRLKKSTKGTEELRPTLMQKEHSVGEFLGNAGIVRDHDTGEPELVLEALNERAKATGRDGIDHGGGLVIQDDLRLSSQRASHGHGAFASR